MELDEAEALTARITEETSLNTVVVRENDHDYTIDIDLPTHGDELRVTATANEVDDWAWTFETQVRRRLDRPAD